MESYEMIDNSRRVVCKEHGIIRCSVCAYVKDLEAEVSRLQDELAGDGVLTLPEKYAHAKAETERMYKKASDYASIALWCARRLDTRQHAEYAYDELEKVYGYEIDRDWRGEQV